MPNSQTKKRLIRKLRNWRSNNKDGTYRCTAKVIRNGKLEKCNKIITGTIHHFRCNTCWKKRKGLI